MQQIDYKGITIQLSKSRRAKRLRLSYSPRKGQFRLKTPFYILKKEIDRFLETVDTWINQQLTSRVEETVLSHGVSVSLLGQTYLICFQKDIKKKVVLAPAQVIVLHPSDGYADLLEKWMKEYIEHFFIKKSEEFARQLQVNFSKITIKDMSSRWGSCSSSGRLSYSWRMIFAPLEVAEYLCAHEVSHLKHMNHSSEFWETVSSLCPQYKHHRQWLRHKGKTLFSYRIP